MWLAARQTPDFRTINRFRSERMKEVLESVFTSILTFLVEENYVTLDYYFVDGTKIVALKQLEDAEHREQTEITSEKLADVAEKLKQKLLEKPKDKELKKAVRTIRKDYLPRHAKYEHQFIVGYSLHQRPTDTRCLIPHLTQLEEKLGMLPKTVIADAGYGGEENYSYLEDVGIQSVIKYNTYHKEQTKKWKTDVSRFENWPYDSQTNSRSANDRA